MNITYGRERHIAAERLCLNVGVFAEVVCMLGLAGCAYFYSATDISTVGACALASVFGIASDKDGYLGVFLQNSVLVLHHSTGHAVVPATAEMILLH